MKSSIKEEKYFIPSGIHENERLFILHEVFGEPTKRFLKSALDTKNTIPLKIADVGCGTGQMTQWLCKNTIGQVVGIDNDKQQINTARLSLDEDYRKRIKFICHDINQDLEHEQFDIVYCRFLLHHLPYPAASLAKLWQMVKKNGKLIIGEPIMDGRWIHPKREEYYEIYNLHFKNQAGHAWDPNYGKKLLLDVRNLDGALIHKYEHFRPILVNEKYKRHHLLVLEIFGNDFIKKGLLSEAKLKGLKQIATDIAADHNYISDLFGLVLVCVEKT